MRDVTSGQLALLIASIALFAVGQCASLARIWWERRGLRMASKASLLAATGLGAGTLVWHAAQRGGWLPLEDNFDALIWLGLLLAGFVLYTQQVHPLRGLDWFVIPIVILLLASAAIFGKTNPHEYDVTSVWAWTHRVAAYGGAVALFVAGAVGAMYLMALRRLRDKRPLASPRLGSLERLEHLTFLSVTLGFSLLTIGVITGIVRWTDAGGPALRAKVILTGGVWVLYATILHSPINPSFRGRKTAVLSVAGLILLVGTIVAVQFMPGK